MLTNEFQQGLEFSAKIFINRGDTIACESPIYLGALNAFMAYGLKFLEIPMDENGMIVEELEKALEEETNNIKIIYTIPDFQNPSRITMNMKKENVYMN